ncbi:FAD-dependent oxidoreductase [Rhodococcus sp. H29-C3]|uniref:FAD-dependent oxidoreductase n=1 Tax=Rhodococcus sp. H29-C3 TaxID=3046307 RepID=UPI0024B9D2B3|nr:FAD-dependent oxidoreductase [Rhodococcus sp. H29-C3]MDJ0360323.1 FAD-dependent oxidoreductase [Rhodococcus sp. H29-C3]
MHESIECDVLVIGSGGGALTGAYCAAEAGQDTLVLEKTPLLGGTSAYSGGAVWLPGTAVQDRANIGDSTAKAREYLRSVVGDYEVDRQEAFVSTAPDVVDLLEKNPHIEFEWRPFPDYFRAPGRMDSGRAINALDIEPSAVGDLLERVRPELDADRDGAPHPEGKLGGGRALISRLLLALESTGNSRVLTETALTELIVEDDAVVGALATGPDGKTLRILARRGVLIAAGGIEKDQPLRDAESMPGLARWSMAPEGSNTGDAIQAAVRVGADTTLAGQAWYCPGVALPDGSAAFMVGVRGGLLVDDAGKRYLNESLPYDQFGRAMIEHGSERSYLIFEATDSAAVIPTISIPSVAADAHFEAGTWVTADTIEELAALIEVSPEVLCSTVDQFNEYATTGIDEQFHRGEDPYDKFFCRPVPELPNAALTPLKKGPYVAARIVLSDLGTKSGVRTDVDARVLRENDTPIAGLYAAGNTSASLSGAKYPGPGVPLGTAMVFAYRAVRAMLS